MSETPTRSFLSRVRDAWRAFVGPAKPEEKRWTDEDVKALASEVGNREARLLLLFCEGARPGIPASELSAKFGCGEPFDAERDTPRLFEFCASRLDVPIVRTAAAGSPLYVLRWTGTQKGVFVGQIRELAVSSRQRAAGSTRALVEPSRRRSR